MATVPTYAQPKREMTATNSSNQEFQKWLREWHAGLSRISADEQQRELQKDGGARSLTTHLGRLEEETSDEAHENSHNSEPDEHEKSSA